MKIKYGSINSWTEKKLEFVRKYLQAYVTVFKLQRWVSGVTYIDLFAGPGICYSKRTKTEVYGSPMIAWNVNPKFSDYYFCDNDHNNTYALKQLFIGQTNIHIEEDDANKYIDKLIKELDPEKPTFVFLDPQSLNLHFNTIQKLISKIKIVDFLINFPAGQMLLRETAKKECATCKQNIGQCKHCIEPIFEDHRWKKLTSDYYNNKMKAKVYLRSILKLYMEPFERSGFKWAVKHVVNSNNSQMYDLIFASCNVYPAMKIMRDVMFSEEPSQLFPFSSNEIRGKICYKYSGLNTMLSTKDILSDFFTGDNVYRWKDVQDALRKLEQEKLLQRLSPVSKRRIRFDLNERFRLLCNKPYNANLTAENIP